ncbi:MAG: T9SS type A sorting domain-containing protein [Bacteroidota bacterium]
MHNARKILLLTFSITLACNAFAQLQILSIPNNRNLKPALSKAARLKELTAAPLPFWDDFSYASDTVVYPNDTIWQYGQSVWTNNGAGINAPTLGVATFNGFDSLGKPYSVNDILAKGIADQLVSRPIRLDLVEDANRGTVYISFYFQFRGNGEPPDAGDQLLLSIKDENGKWDIINVIENDGTLKFDEFSTRIVPITGDQYFHDAFQFRFQSFGRLSGPYDTWNIDYVYLNQGRSPEDTSFPDRTITSPPTSLFNSYYAMPLKHFLIDPVGSMIKPTVPVFNLKSINDSDPGSPPDEQPFNYTTTATLYTTKNKEITDSVTVALDTKQEPGFNISPFEVLVLTVKTTPDPSLFSPEADSIHVLFKLGLSTKDSLTPTFDGDYDSLKYQPIDFRVNDTTRSEYILADYYAYDDGTAEYGASLVQPGSQLAYLFELPTNDLDTIVRIDLYFPKFGDESVQLMQLQILRDLTNSPGSTLYTENITIQQSQQNKVWRHVLTRPIGIDKLFYIALKQNSSSIIAIGLDKNTDSGAKMFFNANGTWIQNVNVKGSLMIRPAFGKGEGVITALEEQVERPLAYPNPTTGVFFMAVHTDQVQIFDITGKLVEYDESILGEQKRIELKSPIPGMYILKIFKHAGIFTEKIMVRQ